MRYQTHTGKTVVIRGIVASLITSILLSRPAGAIDTPTATVPVRVFLRTQANRVQLVRAGKPYFIKGAGGSASLDKLREAGANSLRTWGTDNLGTILDEAQKRGLTVCAGIWMGHKEHGFRYDDPGQVAAQQERVRQAVTRYKNHPALLLWAVGNEMEGFGRGDDPLIWKAVNDAAALVKELDPNHPTMTVVSEIGGERVKSINTLCPAIDIVGINSYAGGPSLAERYQKAGGVKPYIVTEFGPPGTWEVGKTAWGAPKEPTSTAKAASYRRTYEKSVADQPLCLGSYAFTWGFKQEATATWFGMFLPDGNKLAAVDTMTALWSGKPAANLCPEIVALRPEGPDQVVPGATVHVTLEARDPEAQPLAVRWVLQKDPLDESQGGDIQATPPTYPDAVTHGDNKGADVRLPPTPGAYRLFAYVGDGAGGGAVANVPLLARVEGAATPLRRANLPLTLYAEPGQSDMTYTATGWMGNTGALRLDPSCTTRPHAGSTCLKAEYAAPDGWGGIVWQSPAGDWGEKPGGLDLGGAKRLVFWARGETGGEVISVGFGLLGLDKPYGDSGRGKRGNLRLTTDWQRYELPLTGEDLSRIKTAFYWTVAAQGKPVTFYLDDIRFE